MESMVNSQLFGNIYQGRRVLLTGHTGFKGSWLTLWLKELGGNITGIALPPEARPNHWDLLNLDIEEHLIDIRDSDILRKTIKKTQPEIIFHLAAQPLVRRSYSDPLETWSTNVMGTVNLLEACRVCPSIKAIVVITTDKCYENEEWIWGYRENDRLGGYDPYSASKAGTELVVASYRKSFFIYPGAPLLATARAGNVIGGGDWSEDRLIPDIVRSVQNDVNLLIRSPQATRPWQHVLESLSGYLLLGQKLLCSDKSFAEAWNFGPGFEGNQNVEKIITLMKSTWPAIRWQQVDEPRPHEALLLQLDSTKARQKLNWKPVWSFIEGVTETANWYKTCLETGAIISNDQIKRYISKAREDRITWTRI
ncbi:MAG: CDP-glucose 4,6-dehydratase [Candidatus Margulisbacteria bacterium GWF2_35_9]|nr:MAG: CDP-glucose 4,6-dehydratase [Candidatus Margulisbacteria bacterium GWF2_35_9]